MKPTPEIINRLRDLLIQFNPNNPGTIFSLAHRPPQLSGPYQDFLGNVTFFFNTEVSFLLVYLLGFSRIHLDMNYDTEGELDIFRHTLIINESVGNSGDHPWHIKVGVATHADVEPMSMDEVYDSIIESISVSVDFIAGMIDPGSPPWKIDERHSLPDTCWDCEYARLKNCPLNYDPSRTGPDGKCVSWFTNPRVEYGDSPRKRAAMEKLLGREVYIGDSPYKKTEVGRIMGDISG